jgi:hypothetical protein
MTNPTNLVSKRLVKEIAELCENFGIGVYSPPDPGNRTIFTGELPSTITNSAGADVSVSEALWIVESPSPAPHSYIDTEYTVLDFWARSPKTARAHALLELVFNNFNRRYGYQTANWTIYFSHALGSIVDVDRDRENGKLFRLSVQFYCRNLNTLS